MSPLTESRVHLIARQPFVRHVLTCGINVRCSCCRWFERQMLFFCFNLSVVQFVCFTFDQDVIKFWIMLVVADVRLASSVGVRWSGLSHSMTGTFCCSVRQKFLLLRLYWKLKTEMHLLYIWRSYLANSHIWWSLRQLRSSSSPADHELHRHISEILQVRLQIAAIKRVTRICWFPSAYKSYVCTIL
jgi:hypothetical protein